MFECQIEKASSVTDEIFILGDMNIDYLKPQDVNVIWKDGIVPTYNLKQMVQVATRVTNESATLINHIYASKEQLICELNVPEIGLSDHFPVCCTIKTKINQAYKGHKDINYRSDHKLNLVSFLQDLNEIDWSLCRDKNVNRAISYFNDKFLNTMNRHAPMKHKRVKYEIQPVWFSSEIKEAIDKRNKCKKNKDTENYRIWRNQVVKLIKQGKSNYYKHAIIDNKGNTSKMWRYMNDMIGKKRTRSPNTLQIGKEMITDQHEVVEQFNQHFANVADRLLSGTPLVDYSPLDLLLGHVMSKVPLGAKFEIPLLNCSDVTKALLELNSNKATGVDELSAKFLKMAAPVIAEPISHVINNSISEGVFQMHGNKLVLVLFIKEVLLQM